MKIKSLNGIINFREERFLIEGEDTRYFKLTNQLQANYISERLKEFTSYYSNRLSYKEVEVLVERLTGQKQLSDEKIQQIVVDKAVEYSKNKEAEVKKQKEKQALKMPATKEQVDIYAVEEKEILIFNDAILVKGQKAIREKRKGMPESSSNDNYIENKTKRVSTDVVMLEKKKGDFEYITGLINNKEDESVSLEDLVKNEIIKEYGQEKGQLNFVAITDGAKDIRTRLLSIFGITITIILDWYHLSKKVRELMSMIAQNKEEKIKHIKQLLYYLWRGMGDNAIEYLKKEVTARNKQKLFELITYIEKHKTEIIDYSKRSKVGKSIGSGRMEKGVDQVIGFRQKKKGMSWSEKGSKGLGILKVAELNNKWKEIWFSGNSANKAEDNSSSQLPLAANF